MRKARILRPENQAGWVEPAVDDDDADGGTPERCGWAGHDDGVPVVSVQDVRRRHHERMNQLGVLFGTREKNDMSEAHELESKGPTDTNELAPPERSGSGRRSQYVAVTLLDSGGVLHIFSSARDAAAHLEVKPKGIWAAFAVNCRCRKHVVRMYKPGDAIPDVVREKLKLVAPVVGRVEPPAEAVAVVNGVAAAEAEVARTDVLPADILRSSGTEQTLKSASSGETWTEQRVKRETDVLTIGDVAGLVEVLARAALDWVGGARKEVAGKGPREFRGRGNAEAVERRDAA